MLKLGLKVGTKIRFIEEVEGSDCTVFTIDNVYKIIDYDSDYVMYRVVNDNGDKWCIDNQAFEVVKSRKKKLSEVDILDCFKSNEENYY